MEVQSHETRVEGKGFSCFDRTNTTFFSFMGTSETFGAFLKLVRRKVLILLRS